MGRLQREGRLGAVSLEDVSVPRRGQRFAIVMDTAMCEGAEELAEGADLLLAESTFADGEAELAETYKHLTAGQAGALAGAGAAGTLVITHFSSRYTGTGELLEQARARAASAVVEAAEDLDRYGLGRRRGF